MVDEDIEGEVVMVRLGADDGMMDPDEAVEQGLPYMELKPSTTLLVPVELVEGQHGLVDGAQMDLPELRPTVVADESHGSFSLMLDVDEDGDKGIGILPMENNLQSCDPSIQYQVMDTNEILAKPEVILLSTEDQDTTQCEEASQEEIEMVDGNYIDGTEIVQLQADFETESTEANQESDDAKKQKAAELVMLTEDHESAAVSVSVPATLEECLAAVESLAQVEAADVAVEAKDKHHPAEEREEPEENGTSAETEPITEEEELQDRKSSMEADEEKDEEIKTEKETQQIGEGSTRTDESVEEKPVKQALSLNSELDEEPVQEPTTSQRKKTPSTPTRRMTRGRMVTFISPLSEEANEPEDDREMEDTKTSTLVPASPSRTPRKGKQAKETKVPASTPRRSTRKTQPELPKEEDEEVEVMDNNTSVASTSKASSPSRRSQRVAATRTSQRTQSGSEVSAATDDEVKHEEEVTVIKPSRRTSSKIPTPSKHAASQVKTPRRSSRRITSSTEVVATPLEIVKEEHEQDEVFASPVRRSSRRTKTEASETLSTVLEKVEDKEEQLPSPGRTTRHSSQISLTVYPQVRIQKADYNL